MGISNISINSFHGNVKNTMIFSAGFRPILSYKLFSIQCDEITCKYKIQNEQNTNTNEFHGILGGNKPASVKAFRFTDLGHSPTF